MKWRGFTLVEVMVALAIVAIALPALLMALSQQLDDTAYMRDKSIAQMVAANKLAEMRIVVGNTRSLQAGKSNGVDTMFERDWYWWVETLPTPVAKFFRVEIDVALDEARQDQPLYTLTAFMNGDLEIDAEGLQGEGEGDLGFGDGDTSGDGGQPGNDESPVEVPDGTETLREEISEDE